MVHALKIYPEYYEAVKSGKKPFEVRKNDRDFKIGDYLALNEFIQNGAGAGEYTGRSIIARISYIFTNEEYCKDGFAILGLNPCELSDLKNTKTVLSCFRLPTFEFKEVTRNV